jgi:xanthine dehydrogenase YagS FAD-binding subunit
MKAFEYAGPTSVDEALKALGGEGALALSGGTDLISRMKDYVATPKRVVYLKDIKDLAGIRAASGGGIEIGAGTRLVDILNNKDVNQHYPSIRQATLEVGTPQIRNMATLGGNLLQRPRCWYYRHGFGLLGGKKENKSLIREVEGQHGPIDVSDEEHNGHVVRLGDNRYSAIFLTDGDALFVSPSSLAVPLIAMGSKATIVGPKGERTVPVEELYQVPKKEGDSELTLAPGELLTKVIVPPCKGKNASYEVRQKQAHDWPLVMASVALRLDGDKVTQAKVVLYGVAPIPWRSEPAEKAIVGSTITDETATKAAEAAIKDAKPLSKNAYKVGLTKTAVKRALLLTTNGKRYWEEA